MEIKKSVKNIKFISFLSVSPSGGVKKINKKILAKPFNLFFKKIYGRNFLVQISTNFYFVANLIYFKLFPFLFRKQDGNSSGLEL